LQSPDFISSFLKDAIFFNNGIFIIPPIKVGKFLAHKKKKFKIPYSQLLSGEGGMKKKNLERGQAIQAMQRI
jgi:hypothetical protein